jgi:hypothetical protein
MGGFYFSINMVLSQIGCWIAAYLYLYKSSSFRNNERDGMIPDSSIFNVLALLCSAWFLAVILFFYMIKRPYWNTFYSTNTGCQQAMSYFLDNDDDAKKALIFTRHTDLWKPIEKEVMAWTHANWKRWKVEKPDWFTERFIKKVPDEFIPNDVLNDLNTAAGGSRRRSSVFESAASAAAEKHQRIHY